ncbi:acyl-CoA N-acyltransferase [Cladochytrium replicatum]|nr:acyl-CoA N-acyltransferase [Cladochytrium replicatum]
MPRIEALDTFPIKTDRCTIRFFDPTSDIEQLQTVANNQSVARYLTDDFPSPYTIQDALHFTAAQSYQATRQKFLDGDDRSLESLCVEIDGKVCGSMGYGFKSDLGQLTVSLGFWSAESVWGKGYGTECVRWLVEFINREEPAAVQLEAELFALNTGSRRVLEKCGFVCESISRAAITKGGVVYDKVTMALVLEKRLKENCIPSVS